MSSVSCLAKGDDDNKQLEHLAENMTEISDKRITSPLWQERDCFFLDTFPVYIFKPKDFAWDRALFQGKYGGPVLEVSSSSRFLLCDFISV